MNKGFWEKLPRPFFGLAPMADVTDVAYREIISDIVKPDVMFTEFVSCDGLLSAGYEKLKIDLAFTERQRPIVAQIFSGTPEKFFECAKLIRKLGFDGIDINMGCPDRSIEKSGAGASLIKDPDKAIEIMKKTKEGAGNIPVSVKTRTGYNEDEIDKWIPKLLLQNPIAITIHARTRKQMSKVDADWSTIKKAVDIRNKLQSDTLIIGNGDIKDLYDGLEKIQYSGCDGVLMGRAIFGNPWLFSKNIKKGDLSEKEILEVLIKHTRLFEKYLSDYKNFAIMRKHFGSYVSGFSGGKELKMKLMEVKNGDEVEKIIKNYLNNK